MQRENRILNRRGIAMIMAIFFILLIGGIMAVVFKLTAVTTQRTGKVYLYEQAVALSRSATEYAMLAVSGHNHVTLGNCINRIDAQYPSTANPMFDINITLRYIGFGALTTGDGCLDYIATTNTVESNGSILMDVVVTDHNLTGEPIRYYRRSLQKM